MRHIFRKCLFHICDHLKPKILKSEKIIFGLYMGILKSLGAPDTRQTCFFRSFFVIDLFYIAKVTSFYGVLFLLWLTIEKTGILIYIYIYRKSWFKSPTLSNPPLTHTSDRPIFKIPFNSENLGKFMMSD